MAEKREKSDIFLKLLVPNQKRILAYILRYVPNRSDADDILQNTISVLWDKFDQYELDTDFLAWSVVTARYEVMTFYKKQKKNGHYHFDEELQSLIECDYHSAHDQFEDQVDALRHCLKKLAHPELKLLDQRYKQELTFERIAEQVGLSSVAVFKRISRIHSRLVRCIRLRLSYVNRE